MTTIRHGVNRALALLFQTLEYADRVEAAASTAGVEVIDAPLGEAAPARALPPASSPARPALPPAAASEPSPRAPRPTATQPSQSVEAVYRAVIGADAPLALRQVVETTGLSRPALYRAIRRLLEEQRIHRGGPESSQYARYAVTPDAADAAYRMAKG